MFDNRFIQIAIVSLLYTVIRAAFGFEAMATVALATIVAILLSNKKN